MIRRGLANAVDNISRDALRQYGDWVLSDQFRSIDHRLDYRRELGRLRTPLLLIAGAKDILAPPSSMEELLKEAASPVKELKIAGRAAGFEHDYGHADLSYGERAEEEGRNAQELDHSPAVPEQEVRAPVSLRRARRAGTSLRASHGGRMPPASSPG